MEAKKIGITCFVGGVTCDVCDSTKNWGTEIRMILFSLCVLGGMLLASTQVVAAPMYSITDMGTNGQVRVVGMNTNGTFLYLSDLPQGLQTLGNYVSGANANGQVVGRYNPIPDAAQHAFLYQNGSMQDLGVLGDGGNNKFTSATGINNHGQVVGCGTLTDFWGQDQAGFLYSNGSMQAIGSDSTAYGINNNGQVVGSAWDNGISYTQAYLYSNGLIQFLGAGRGSNAMGVNDNGQVVGYGFSMTNPRAFLYSNGSVQNLNNLIDPSLGWTLVGASSINNLGQIFGEGFNPTGQDEAYLLTPVPEPTTLCLLGLASLVALRRRHKS